MGFLCHMMFLCLAVLSSVQSRDATPPETERLKEEVATYLPTEPQEVVVVPSVSGSDEALVIHDFEREVTVYKDVTAEQCFLSPLYPEVTLATALVFRYRPMQQFAQPHSRRNVYLRTQGGPIENLREIAGDEIGDLCEGYPTIRIYMPYRRRRRDVHLSGCVNVNVGSDGVSGSTSVSAGGRGSSARVSGESGGGVSCSACGSIGLGRDGISASGSVAVSDGGTSAQTSSDRDGTRASASATSGRRRSRLGSLGLIVG